MKKVWIYFPLPWGNTGVKYFKVVNLPGKFFFTASLRSILKGNRCKDMDRVCSVREHEHSGKSHIFQTTTVPKQACK